MNLMPRPFCMRYVRRKGKAPERKWKDGADTAPGPAGWNGQRLRKVASSRGAECKDRPKVWNGPLQGKGWR